MLLPLRIVLHSVQLLLLITAVKCYHSAITLTLNSLDEQPLDPFYWKFNSCLSDDPSDVDLISTKYYEWVSEFIDVNENCVPLQESTKLDSLNPANIVRKKQENVETIWLTLNRRFMSIMIFIDIHKAFDSLQWDFIVNCLEAFNFGTILTAHIISQLHGKGSSSSNFSVLYLRTSGMVDCDLGFKYRNFSRLVVSSTEFGEVAVKVSPLLPPQVAVDPLSYIYTRLALAVKGILPVSRYLLILLLGLELFTEIYKAVS